MIFGPHFCRSIKDVSHEFRNATVRIPVLRENRDRNGPVHHGSHCCVTPQQLEVFLETEFTRLVQEAGVKGARVHVERAIAADYDQVLREVTACLSSAKLRAA